jgi:RHS repeat-associated protein
MRTALGVTRNIVLQTQPTNGDRFTFQGGALDTTTGTTHFGSRDDQTTVDRWFQQDPTGLTPDVNTYRGFHNDAVNLTDPTGLADAKMTDEQKQQWKATIERLREKIRSGNADERKAALAEIGQLLRQELPAPQTRAPDPETLPKMTGLERELNGMTRSERYSTSQIKKAIANGRIKEFWNGSYHEYRLIDPELLAEAKQADEDGTTVELDRSIISPDEMKLLAATALAIFNQRVAKGFYSKYNGNSRFRRIQDFGTEYFAYIDLGPWPDKPNARLGAVVVSDLVDSEEGKQWLEQRLSLDPKASARVGPMPRLDSFTAKRVYFVGVGPGTGLKKTPERLYQFEREKADAADAMAIYNAIDLAPLSGTAKKLIELEEAADRDGLGKALVDHGPGVAISFTSDLLLFYGPIVKSADLTLKAGRIVSSGASRVGSLAGKELSLMWRNDVGALNMPGRGANRVVPFQVGPFNELEGLSPVGDDLALHHVGQKHVMGQIIPGYDPQTGPAIALPTAQHRRIPNLTGEYNGTARDLLARDIRNLRNFTDAPNESLLELIRLNKRMFPEAFAK